MSTRALLPLAALLACADDPKPSPDDSASDTATDTGEPFTGPPEVLFPTLALDAAQLAIVVNSDDALSADIADYYASARGVDTGSIVSLALGTSGTLDTATFEAAKAELDAALSDDVQVLLLAFTTPYAVDCMGASAAFALGFDEAYCSTPCSETRASDYYGSDSVAPWTDHGMRPAMMLSADTLEEAMAYIDRGVAADDTNPDGDGWFIRTTDEARSVRYGDFRTTVERFDPDSLKLTYVDNADGSGSDLLTDQTDVLFYLTGLTRVDDIATNTFRPGALADHLTSYGGLLSDSNGQMPITEWLEGGATASYGTALEPCNYPTKFPEAEVLVSRYFMGATAIEAYWKSVAWPGEGNWVGEPLARPFSPTWTWVDGVLTISTPHMNRRSKWALEGADSEDGPWEALQEDIGPELIWQRMEIVQEDAWQRYYRLVQE